MQRCAFTPYEGNKPYIFISYAHKDSKRVYPILEELNRRGYRVWYDDGIAPGSEWPENIAQHLSDCALTLAFISPSSIASDNCRREVTFALSKRKPFLGILLEPTEMSLGMEMQLSAQQCIMKYSYATEASFYDKVCSCPDLQPCLEKQEQKPAVTPVQAAPAVQPQPKQPAKPLDKKMIGIIAGAAAAVVILAVILIAAFSGGNGDPDPSGDHLGNTSGQNQPSQSQTQGSQPSDSQPGGDTGEVMLVYADQTITAEDIAYISQQKQLVWLEIRNCVFQTMEGLTLADTVTEVKITDCEGVTDLHCLSALKELITLDLYGCGLTDSAMTPLTSEKLIWVDVSGNPEFTALDVFSACTAMERINFSETAVASVEPLAKMTKLLEVKGSITNVTDITPLAALTELNTLEFAFCGIASVTEPFYSLRLDTVDLSFNQLDSLDFLQYCTTLRQVNLSYNNILDMDILEKSTVTLESLNVSGNESIYEWDLEFLPSCSNLKELSVDDLNLVNLELVHGMTWLDKLSAVNCRLRDISALEGMTQLSYLNLACNYLEDVSALAGLDPDFLTLDLSFNSLRDVSALPVGENYQLLNLTGNLLDAYTIPLAGGQELVMSYYEALEDPNCMNEDNRSIFAHVSIVDCPMDKVVAMENRFGKERTALLQTVEDYLTFLDEKGVDCTSLLMSLPEG